MSNSNSGNRNKTLLLLIASIVLTSPVYGTSPDSDIIESSCITTLYPDICYSTLSTTKNLATKKDVIQHTINKTKEIIRGSFNTIKNLTATDNVNKRCKIALHDCIEMVAGTLEDLDMVIRELKAYPTKKSLRRHANDLITLMSTTITNKETCLDDLSYDPSCKQLCNSIIQGQDLGGKMCSNVLAMIKNMTHTDMANKPELDVEHFKEEMWPEWLSMKDRKLLGLLDITPHVTVAKDGKGNYTTVAEAVEAAPEKSLSRYVIKIKEGVYEEYVRVPKSKKNLMFIGDGKEKTIITGNKNVANGNSTTWQSATVAAMGNGFLARDITFQNTAGPSGHQAVALRVGSDLSAFYRCAILGYQDTLYGTTGRQFYKSKISATPELQEVQANFSTYLGRPWKNYSRTVVMESMISDVIEPKGWHPWDGDFALDTLYYREYENIGPGADTSKRVNWTGWGVMKTRLEAIPFTAGPFINGLMWLPTTGFPFWPGW
ncbi:hypothetical protein L2E82_27798 [Cichorium intybus]|uniref:Uncharacterized protein n=1 Tax=Cichorium intybus TaxID=13427 RepID=A0ACB9CU86_CICIN|nr:hypothetical protein L2E82_27798 [Cichorium intybus]